jgi:hypothetical protein
VSNWPTLVVALVALGLAALNFRIYQREQQTGEAYFLLAPPPVRSREAKPTWFRMRMARRWLFIALFAGFGLIFLISFIVAAN